jgi:hypothetical protein
MPTSSFFSTSRTAAKDALYSSLVHILYEQSSRAGGANSPTIPAASPPTKPTRLCWQSPPGGSAVHGSRSSSTSCFMISDGKPSVSAPLLINRSTPGPPNSTKTSPSTWEPADITAYSTALFEPVRAVAQRTNSASHNRASKLGTDVALGGTTFCPGPLRSAPITAAKRAPASSVETTAIHRNGGSPPTRPARCRARLVRGAPDP